jgi:hypothetical protein
VTNRFLVDFERVVDDIFNKAVKQAASGGLLDLTYRSIRPR